MTDKEFWRHWCEMIESVTPDMEFWKQVVKTAKQTKGQRNMNKKEFVVKDSGNREEVAGKARLVEQHTGLNDMPKFEESEEL